LQLYLEFIGKNLNFHSHQYIKYMPLDQQHEVERGEMSFFEHVEDLRKVIVRSALAIAVVGIGFFLNKSFIFETLLYGPRDPNFPTFRILCSISHATGFGESMCFTPPKFELIATELGEILMQHIYLSFWLGVIGAFPFIFWQIWQFVQPGLLETEQKVIKGVVSICSLLFFMGVAFGYYVIAPFSINFLASYTAAGTTVSPKLDSYVTYMTMFTIPTGLIFEMPIVAYFLAKLGVIGSNFMSTYRRHAIVVIFIIAAIITPPDVVSQTLVAIPLLVLYEASIQVVKRIEKKRTLALDNFERKDLTPLDE
jgi:sec-independent protein translocase protein TatC